MADTANPEAGQDAGRGTGSDRSWTFLTNHARVLAAIARDPAVRVRDIAATCLLTERAVQKIVADLEAAGYITRARTGRRNTYQIAPGTKVRHPADGGREVADLLALFSSHPSQDCPN